MPRPSGQQMRMHSQHLSYDPYSYPRASYHQPYGPSYEYYRKQGMGPPPQAISPAYPSPAETVAVKDAKKKPPRPYTEYNIFFQLERERILTELEDKKKEKDGEGDEGDEDLSSSIEKVLNQPSDENDLLPRPPQFAHLKLSPKWYDSTVRIAQNKLNKSKRKHRKTHGLVGFLDLTKMISKAWAAADAETKGYCKRLAERQLGYYKEELKAIKQQRSEQQQHLLMGQYPPQNMHMGYNGSYGYHNRLHMAPPPPPPSYWQQHSMSRPPVHSGPSYPEQFPHTPPSQETYIEDQREPNSRPSGKMHPLEELMLRRRLYGSRSSSAQPKKSHTTWPSQPAQTVTSTGGERIPHSQAYVSPAESGTTTKESVTPSPPQKQDPSTPTLPVKKRLTKEDSSDTTKEHTPRSPGDGNNSSPISASFPSPSEMMSNMFNSSPLSNSSYQRALGPYLSDSPMPYMEFSPQESIGSPIRHPATVPKHLAFPTSYGAPSLRVPNKRGCRSPFSDELANDILDFDEEEMDYMWNQLANSARARRNARAAAAKELFRMNNEASIASPGNTNAFGLAHSFASPTTAIPDTKVPSPGISAPPLPSIDESAEKQDSDS